MSEPLRSAASTTTTASDSPAITALRVGKWCGSGGVPGANCESSAPRVAISSARRPFSCGYTTSTPEPTRLLSISYAVFCLKKKKKNLDKDSLASSVDDD